MAAELGQTDDPQTLVPGDAGAVTGTMWAMRSYGDSLLDAGTGLTRIDTNEGWQGQAGQQFRDRFDGEPRKWIEAGDSFHRAAAALDSYVSTLRWAQQQAAEAIRLWNEGNAATAAAEVAHDRAVRQAEQNAANSAANGVPATAPDIPFHDPGEATREAARRLLNRARTELRSAGDAAAGTVGAARDRAPAKPGFWSTVGDFVTGVGDGLLDAGVDVANGLAGVGNAVLNHPATSRWRLVERR